MAQAEKISSWRGSSRKSVRWHCGRRHRQLGVGVIVSVVAVIVVASMSVYVLS